MTISTGILETTDDTLSPAAARRKPETHIELPMIRNVRVRTGIQACNINRGHAGNMDMSVVVITWPHG